MTADVAAELPWVEALPAIETRSPDWHEMRRRGLTASEIAVVLGISPWVSPWALWMRKRGDVPDQADSAAMRFGRRFENAIIEEFLERHPEFELYEVGLCSSRARPWQLATPDGLLVESLPDDGNEDQPVAVVEAKTADSFDEWGDEGTDEVPPHYRAQVLWQLDVIGVDTAFMPVVARGKQYREFVIALDEQARSDIRFMRERAAEFLRRDEPPPIDGHAATTTGLKAMFADEPYDDDIVIPKTLARRYARARVALDVAETRRAKAENEIRARIGHARRAVLRDGSTVASRSQYQRRSVDSKRLRRELPDVWSDYVNNTTVDRLNAGPAGKGD